MIDILIKYMDYKKYHQNKKYVGCIFYGSANDNTYNENSDIDVIFVFDDENHIEKKGYTKFKNVEIEYFERSIDALYKRIDKEIGKRNDSFYSIIGKGNIIEDTDNKINKLQKYAIEQYENNWNKEWGIEEIKYKIRNLYKCIKDLKELSNNDYFNIYYGIVVEKIRITYHELNNLSRIGSSKVYKYYNKNDNTYKLPPEGFISLYKKCIKAKSVSSRIKAVEQLYKFVNKYDFDVTNIEIELGGAEF